MLFEFNNSFLILVNFYLFSFIIHFLGENLLQDGALGAMGGEMLVGGKRGRKVRGRWEKMMRGRGVMTA